MFLYSSFLVFLILSPAICSQPFQLRRVYYNQNENICAIGEHEFVPIIFVIEDEEPIIQNLNAGVSCVDSYLGNYWRVFFPGFFVATVHEYQFQFDVKLERFNPLGIERTIIAKATLETKTATLKGLDYVCQIVGDGHVQHFNQNGKEVTSRIKIQCKRKYTANLKALQN